MSIAPRKRGDTWFFRVGPIKRDGAVVDLNGASIWCTIKSGLTDADPGVAQVTHVSSASGACVATVATGIVNVTIASSVTSVDPGSYWVDVQVVESSGTRTTFGPERFSVIQDVTLS